MCEDSSTRRAIGSRACCAAGAASVGVEDDASREGDGWAAAEESLRRGGTTRESEGSRCGSLLECWERWGSLDDTALSASLLKKDEVELVAGWGSPARREISGDW